MKSKTSKKKNFFRSLFGDLLFAVTVATVVGALFVKAYAIPTPSMEATLLVGDHMFVSKFHYGARLPQTPLQIPLTHQTIWGTNIPSYLDWIDLPYWRLPAISNVRKNDIVVFNYPAEVHEHPVDLRTYYVKRCVGEPGDTLQIVNGKIVVNEIDYQLSNTGQWSYFLKTNTVIRDRFFYDQKISDFHKVNGGYIIFTSPEKTHQLQEMPFIDSVSKRIYEEPNPSEEMFGDIEQSSTIDQYGPLYIPKAGDIIELDEQNLKRYGNTILYFDGNENAELKGGKLYINDSPIETYTFKQDYYFMMGDNRHNSLDSRFWGLVPEDHIVGKPLFIYWSTNSNESEGYFSRIRWDRIFKWVGDA